MLISRGHPVGSMHWAQLAKYEADLAEREEAEAWAKSQAEAEDSPLEPEPDSELELSTVFFEPQEPEKVEPEIEAAPPIPGPIKRGPGRPRKDSH